MGHSHGHFQWAFCGEVAHGGFQAKIRKNLRVNPGDRVAQGAQGGVGIVLSFGKKRSQGGYDNHDPRAWLAQQSGASARANAAQANSFEALPFFIGAVLVAHQLGAGQTVLDLLAVFYVLLRLFYIMMYVSDMPRARSAVWGVALLVNIAIFFIGYR